MMLKFDILSRRTLLNTSFSPSNSPKPFGKINFFSIKYHYYSKFVQIGMTHFSLEGVQFNIPLITAQETQKFIDTLSPSKATGADEIRVKVLKLVSPVFDQPLTRLINLSTQSGRFPTR